MSEQRYTYATVGISEEREEPVVVVGKENASFEIGGEEFERTATLRLPERMSASEFNQWKSEADVDLIDIYFHCLKQRPRNPEPEEVGDNGQEELVTDGGQPTDPIPGEELLPEEEIEHRCRCARKQLETLHEKAEEHFPTSAGFIEGVLDDVDEAEEMVKEEKPVNPPVTDGGSSMPKLALGHLKECQELDGKVAEWLSETTGEEFGSFSDLYGSEHSIPEAGNEIHLGEGFSLKEAEYVELLGMLETARQAAGDDPPTLGIRNRLLMQFIIANPEEYARVKAEEMERMAEAQEEAKQRFNEAMSRQRTNERMAKLNDGVDIPVGEDEDAGN